MQATKMLSESPRFVYVNEYGERDPRLNPDKRESLGRAIEWIADHRGASPRTSFEKFQTGVEKAGLVLDTEAFRAGLNARREVAEGGEHTVYLDRQTQRTLKISHPDVLVGDHDGDNVLARDTKKGVQVFPIDTQLLTSPCWPSLQGK